MGNTSTSNLYRILQKFRITTRIPKGNFLNKTNIRNQFLLWIQKEKMKRDSYNCDQMFYILGNEAM